MCRWLAYSGSPILLETALYSPVHSLIDQSLHSELGAEATNGDGFGVGWYDDQPTPGVFHSIEPAWNDQNLRELAGHITSGHFFAHIRAAIGSPVQQTNCHPFRHGRWLFMHNGYVADLPRVRRDLLMAIDESLFPEVSGTADTEILFYLALTFGLESDPADAVARTIGLVEDVGRRKGVEFPFQGTIATTDGERCGRSATRAKASRGRCSTAATSRRSGGSLPTGRSCSRSPTTRDSWSPSPSVTFPEPGTRCPRGPTGWSARGTNSCAR